jgi:glycerophosphoryl diester phosphodiesterase
VTLGLGAPILVAHRAGNQLAALRAAERREAIVEADVRLFRGRLEVRHLKTVGPLPLLWDRWRLEAPWRPRLLLGDLLEAAGPATALMLDLKGRRTEVAEQALEELRPSLGNRRLTVCARSWRLLEAFAGTPVRRIHSVGTARQLRLLLRRYAGAHLEGVSIHERLLDAVSAAALRNLADEIFTWPVNRPERAAELLGLGVTGLITDDLDRLAPGLPGGAA